MDAVAVHAGAGLIGVMAVPVFAPGGLKDGVTEQSLEKLRFTKNCCQDGFLLIITVITVLDVSLLLDAKIT